MFAMPGGVPPGSWPVRTYVTSRSSDKLDPAIRNRLYPRTRLGSYIKMRMAQLLLGDVQQLAERWLAKVIRQWRPDVIHTLGLDPAAFFYYRVRRKYDVTRIGKWVVTARGGPELTLKRLIPEDRERIEEVLLSCDQFIADNQQNYGHAIDLGLHPDKRATIGAVPGTGGVDIDELSNLRKEPTSRSRIILFPKAYECPASKALPIFEALLLCWNKIEPCKIYLTAMIPETIMWLQTLPKEIREHCHARNRIPREELLELMAGSRVLLIPSLTDGLPNTLFEAMATGSFPILSPIDTIQGVVQTEKNVLFARNLYPQDIADALVRAMTDDELVDRAAKRNLELVKRLADRNTIRMKVTNYYQNIAAHGRSVNS